MVSNSLHSFAIEQIVGLYLIIMGLVMAARATYYRDTLKEFTADKPLILISATLALVIGLTLVVLHNLWIYHFDVIATIISWIILIKAVVWLALPEYMIKFTKKFYKSNGFYVLALVEVLLGLILLIHAYHVFG